MESRLWLELCSGHACCTSLLRKRLSIQILAHVFIPKSDSWLIYVLTVAFHGSLKLRALFVLCAKKTQKRYITTLLSRVFCWVLNFENLYFFGYWSQLLYFFGLLNKSCILKCFIFSTEFFWVQCYSPSASIIMDLHYYHIVLDFCEMNNVLEGIFGFCFSESSFWGFSVSGKAFFGSFRNTQLR